MEIIVGTAGHIDHGKTALVRALTGIDADRLPEEKRRGITIDIGFAELTLGDLKIGFIDVPGHERFVKNMLAGASGIDLVLLVIAADEGVMPQTREHFEICRLLGIKRGIIVLTKRDLVDSEMAELARADAAELVAGSFLESAPVIAVSSITLEGIEELKQEICLQCAELSTRSPEIAAFLPIDRSFSIKGFGAVVTGTLASGHLAEADDLELLPVGRKLRIRGLQSHGKSVERVHSGQRVAVNLTGIDHSEIERGMILSKPNVFERTQIIDAQVEVLPGASQPLRSRQRIRLHLGTVEIFARVFVMNEGGKLEPGETGFIQFRLESPTVCTLGQHFILRSYSPQNTIAGGVVLVPLAEKHRRRDWKQAAKFAAAIKGAEGDLTAIVSIFAVAAGKAGITAEYIQAQTGYELGVINHAIQSAIGNGEIFRVGERYIAGAEFLELKRRVAAMLTAFHNREPLSAGMPREMLRESISRFLPNEVFSAVIAELEREGSIASARDVVRVSSHRAQMSLAEAAVSQRLSAIFSAARLEPPKLDEALTRALADSNLTIADARKIFLLLVKSGEVVKVTDEFYFSAEVIAELVSKLRDFAAGTQDRTIDVPGFKEIAGVSRKYAIPLLEYLDRERVTVRAGDKRLILK